MPSALSRSCSVPLPQSISTPSLKTMDNCMDLDSRKTKGLGGSSTVKQIGNIDPKAVGSHLSHMPLSRRSSIPNFSVSDPVSPFVSSHDSSANLQRHSQKTVQVCPGPQQTLNAEPKRGHRKLDRSQSEPVTRAPLGVAPLNAAGTNANRYKTELCRPFEENGSCKYGDKCQFAHGLHELRSLSRHPKYKTELCKTYHTVGFCPYGPRCHFIHNADEARNSSAPSSGIQRSSKPGAFKILVGSSSDSPSPPSSLSQSPTGSSTFFSDDLFPVANHFSPTIKNFRLGSELTPTLFRGNNNKNQNQVIESNIFFNDYNSMEDLGGMRLVLPDLDSPSLSGSLASDLDSLSLGSNSPPPAMITTPMETSRGLRLPIFSRISERLDED